MDSKYNAADAAGLGREHDQRSRKIHVFFSMSTAKMNDNPLFLVSQRNGFRFCVFVFMLRCWRSVAKVRNTLLMRVEERAQFFGVRVGAG